MSRINHVVLSICVISFSLLGSCTKESSNNNEAPSSPILTYPEYNATEIVPDTILYWEDFADTENKTIHYDLYIGTDPSAMILVDSATTATSSTVSLESNTTYYWKIIAKDYQQNAYNSDIWTFTTLCYPSDTITYGSFTDNRDNKTYKTITIGNQIWMAENLAYEIPDKEITIDSLWTKNNVLNDGWCFYDNSSTNGETYGILYQWAAAVEACPDGWHLPTTSEWEELIDFLANNGYNYDGTLVGDGSKIAKSMAATILWHNSSTVGAVGCNLRLNNSSGFSALPGGQREGWDGSFYVINGYGLWWTATEVDNKYADAFQIHSGSKQLEYTYYLKFYGYSVRCIKD